MVAFIVPEPASSSAGEYPKSRIARWLSISLTTGR
jgi:hypothetical protein